MTRPTLSRLAITLAGLAALAACTDPVHPPDRAGPVRADVAAASAPDNDDVANAVAITALPFSDTVNTAEATPGTDDPVGCFGGPTVWYQFTPSADTWITANTFGSDYDTGLSAYRVTADSGLVLIACNDDSEGVQSSVTFEAVAGQTYYFMAASFDGMTGGTLVFSADVSAPPPPPPPPLEVELSIDPVGSVEPRTGIATIRGTISCSSLAFVDLYGTLRDRIGRLLVEEHFGTYVECDGVTAWEAQVLPQHALLVGGPASVSVFASYYDPTIGDYGYVEASATVHLRR